MVVLGCGALNVDYLFAADTLVTDGETFCYAAERQPGGSAANTIYALAKLGVPCRFAGVVGDDPDGLLVLEAFSSVGVDLRGVAVKAGHGTGRVFCFVDKAGHRALYVCAGANLEVCLEELRRALSEDVVWVHCSSFVGDTAFLAQRELVSTLPPTVRFSFAPGALYARRGLEALRPFLERSDLFFVTLPELQVLTGTGDALAGARALLAAGVKTVVVTRGAAGSLQVGLDRIHEEPALPVAVRDTTGAGDAFAAGFIFGCLKGWPPVETQRFATILASFVVEGWGARATLPTLAAAQTRYAEAYGAPLPALR